MSARLSILAIFSLGLFSSCQVRQRIPNRIDSLASDEDVLSFVKKTSDYPSLRFQLPTGKDSFRIAFWKKYRQALDSFGVKPYEKVDLDNNGLTDLVFSGYDSVYRGPLSIVVLSFEKDSFSTSILPMEGYPRFFAAKTIRIDGQPYLQTLIEQRTGREHPLSKNRQMFVIDKDYYFQRWCDTLDWTLGLPVERWPHGPQVIDTFRYSFVGGLGTSDFFQLTIIHDSLHASKMGGSSLPVPTDGSTIFVARMDSGAGRRLFTLLARIDWQRLDSAYEPSGTDEPSGYFEVSYDAGKKKIIYDNGCHGTFGLAVLQDMLFDLLNRQSWKPKHEDEPGYSYEEHLSRFTEN